MYDALLEWMQFDVSLHAYMSKDLAGDATYAEPVTYKAYRVDTTETIQDINNQTYLSSQRVYLEATVAVTYRDMLSFPEAPDKKYAIHKIGAFYDGAERSKSIQVIYL